MEKDIDRQLPRTPVDLTLSDQDTTIKIQEVGIIDKGYVHDIEENVN